jgi:type VI secretion system protein ImpF
VRTEPGPSRKAIFVMPRIESEVRITPSILDRLVDDEPEVTREPPISRLKSLRQLKQAVRRDLEWLLNTRRLIEDIPEDLKEVQHSVAAFGLPDCTTANVSSSNDQNRVRRLVQATIETYEPALRDVTVTVERGREFERSLHFRIQANLQVEPDPEPVTFDTMLHPWSVEFKVQAD